MRRRPRRRPRPGAVSPSARATPPRFRSRNSSLDGGQIRAKIDAARLTRDATLATYRRLAQTVAHDVATAYYAVLQDERTVAVDDELLGQDQVSENLVRA